MSIDINATVNSYHKFSEVYAAVMANIDYDLTTQANIDLFRENFITKYNNSFDTGVVKLISDSTGLDYHSGDGDETFSGVATKEYKDFGGSNVDIDTINDVTRVIYGGFRDGINKSAWRFSLKRAYTDKFTSGGTEYIINVDPDFDADAGKTPWVLLGNYTVTAGDGSAAIPDGGSTYTYVRLKSGETLSGATTIGFPILSKDNSRFPVNQSTAPNAGTFVDFKGELTDTVPYTVNSGYGHVSNDLYIALVNDYFGDATGSGSYEFRFLGKYNADNDNETIAHIKTDFASFHTQLYTGVRQSNPVNITYDTYDGAEIEETLRSNSSVLSSNVPGYLGHNDSQTTLFDGILRAYDATSVYFRFGYSHVGTVQVKPYTANPGLGTSNNVLMQVWVRTNK
jgi:hypothetical protein